MTFSRSRVRTSTADEQTRESLALRVVEALAAHPTQMQVFLDETGLDFGALRSALDDPSLQGGLLDHALQHETLLIALSEALGSSPDATVAAIRRARPPACD